MVRALFDDVEDVALAVNDVGLGGGLSIEGRFRCSRLESEASHHVLNAFHASLSL